MKKSIRFPDFRSANLKSKIQNLKWLGLSVMTIVLVFLAAVAEAQQQDKIAKIGDLIFRPDTT